jgi:hypothetical protein
VGSHQTLTYALGAPMLLFYVMGIPLFGAYVLWDAHRKGTLHTKKVGFWSVLFR